MQFSGLVTEVGYQWWTDLAIGAMSSVTIVARFKIFGHLVVHLLRPYCSSIDVSSRVFDKSENLRNVSANWADVQYCLRQSALKGTGVV